MITTILLDLDDTILTDDPASEIAFAKTAALVPHLDEHQLITAAKDAANRGFLESPFPEWLIEIGTGPLELLRARFEGDHPNWAIMREWGPGYRLRTWQQALAASGVGDDDLAAQLDASFERERGEANPYCDGAEAALAELADNYRLGMVTNGIPDVQWHKIRATGIAPMFDVIAVSGEVGYGKPDPKIYGWVMEQMGIAPEEAIMVGDNWRRDAIGPQELGIRGVWISMGRPAPDDRQPWLVIESLAELPAILGRK
ncbi:MAG: HAD family hydrolase [Thermomicrobiales bacterium]|nr:HAD family hydrolase [Thermomicrobiales bacterium]